MFEKLIEQLILKYLGDYIEGIDPENLSLGLWSGILSLEKIKLKAKAIDDLKLPFKLSFGLINKLILSISWKTNFSEPTEITIEGLNIVLSLVDTKDWEYVDYTSYESKLEQLMKYSKKKFDNLIQAFNEITSEEQKSYTDKIFVKIVDNLQLIFKDINIRIEEQNKTPFYSIGIILKEMKVINTDKNWESHFIDRNVEKNVTIYKLLEINNFGIYLKLNEDTFISKIENMDEKLEKLVEISTDEKLKDNYLIEPYSLSLKMKQINESFQNLSEEEKKEPKLSFYIELPLFKITCLKEQYDCIFRILNHISKYKKFQKIYYDMRKYNYFKPRYSILDKEHKENILTELPKDKNENAILWFKFSINMILKTIKYYKGNKNIFNIPKSVLNDYKEKFVNLFQQYYKNIEENPQYEFELEEDKYLFKKILTCVDINILSSWADKIIEQDFKQKKINEKKESKKGGYFSYFFGFGGGDEEELFTEEEQKKLSEILGEGENNKEKDKDDLLRDDLFVEFKLAEGVITCSKNIMSKTMKINEGFEINYKGVGFTLANNESLKIFKINTNLKNFGINMFTIINKTVNTVPITYRHLNKEYKGNSFKEIFINKEIENEEDLISFKFTYSPLNDINSTIDSKVYGVNLIYHQTFISRVLTFFRMQGQYEDLRNNVMETYKSFKKQTQSVVSSNITKKNNIKIIVTPRKILIPINKYDIKNSKILVIDIGEGGMDTLNSNLIKDNLNIYNKHYLVDLGTISMKCYENVKDMVKNKNPFDFINEVKLNMTISMLNKKKFSSHEYALMKVVFSIDNVNLHLTEYLYNISLFLTDILSPVQEKDVWSQLILEKEDIAKNTKAMATLLKKNWFNGVYEKYLAIISGGYIYFYKSRDDDEYKGYYYLKDSEVKSSLDSLIILISNDSGSIELKFPNENKFKQWDRCLKERIEEMKFSYEDKTQDINEEENKKVVDLKEIYFRTEINFKSFNCFLYLNDDLNDMNNKQHIFTLSINEMSLTMNLREYDSKMGISIFGLKLYDIQNEINDFKLMANSEDEINKEVKLFNMEITILDEKSPIYTNYQIGINLNIGYLYLIWVPDTIRKLLFFITHNTFLKTKVEKEMKDPNEKLLEQKFISPKEDNSFYPTCDKNNYIYMKIHVNFKKVNIILVQPILKIFYHEIILNESTMDFDMYTDHMYIQGSLGNTQIYDLCEYPFVISSQEKYNPENKLEIFGLKTKEGENQENNEMISFTYYNFMTLCPKFKDNYSDLAEVNINTVFLVYTQEQFLRFLNYFLTEFLGALGAPEIKEEEKELKHFEAIKQINDEDNKNNIINESVEGNENQNDFNGLELKEGTDDINPDTEIKEGKENIDKDSNDNKIQDQTKDITSENENNKIDNSQNNEEIKEENKQINIIDISSNNEDKSKNEIKEENNIINEKNEEIINDKKEPKEKINIFNSTMSAEIKSDKKGKNKENKKEEQDMTFLKLNLVINSPQLILKPRPSFSNYFIAELGLINIQAFYHKEIGKVLKKPDEWRWVTTYQMRLKNCNITRNDGFEILSKTNGIVNMHFTYNTTNDLLLPPDEIDTSFQFDVYFNEFSLNLRQKDFILILECNDLNIMYTDEKDKLYDYAKYKLEKLNPKLNLSTSKSESGLTLNSNELSSSNIFIPNNDNNNDKKIDLSKYMYMFVTLFANRVTLNLFLDDGRELAQFFLDEFFLIFKQRMDFSSMMGLRVRNIEVFVITENNDREVIVSDFSQLINQYDEDDNESIDRKNKNAKSISGSSGGGGGGRSSSDFEEILENLNIKNEQRKDSFIYNELKSLIKTNKRKASAKKVDHFRKNSYYKKLIDLSNFGSYIVKKIQRCEIIDVTNEENEDIEKTDIKESKLMNDDNNNNINNNKTVEDLRDYMTKNQCYARMKINTKHDKFYNIKLNGLKFLIRIDKIYLIQAFFVDGFPFYDPEDKNLPNLFEDNEDNFPAFKFDVEIQNPLICLLSDSIMNSEQEMYCIKSEIKFFIHKEKISNLKKKVRKDLKSYEYAIKKIQNTTNDQKIIKSLEKKMRERTSWKMKVTINDISPFICKLEQVLSSENIFIAKRKITNIFNLSYSSKTKLIYDNLSDIFLEKNKNLFKVSKINANMSFKNIMLFTKVMMYLNYLQGPEYQKEYENLLFYTHKKKEYDKKVKMREEEKLNLKKKNKKKQKKENSKINEIIEKNQNENPNKIIENNINIEDGNQNKIIEENINIENENNKNNKENQNIIIEKKNDKKNKEKKENVNKNIIENNNESDEDDSEDDSESSEENEEDPNEEEEENENENENDESKLSIIDTSSKTLPITNKIKKKNQKNNKDAKSKKSNESPKKIENKTLTYSTTLDKYTLNGLDLILIDNQENSFFPFIHINIPRLEYDSITINSFGIINSQILFQFHTMIYNYVSGIWEPLIENTNCTLINIYDPSNEKHIKNIYKLQINNNNDINKNNKNSKKENISDRNSNPLNINISNLTVSCLYPIFKRWSEAYNKLNLPGKEVIYGEEQKSKEKEKKEKKMKISNHTLYNYTGKQIILDNINEQEDNMDIFGDIQNDEDYIDFNHLNQYQELIDDRKSFDIEYKNIIGKEDGKNIDENNALNYDSQNISNKYNNFIKINLKECRLKENIIKVDKVSVKKLSFKSNLKLSKELSKYSYIVSRVTLDDKKKSIFLYSPLCFKNKTEYIINIKIESPPLPPKTDIKLAPQEILPIPHEYMSGNILIKIGEKTTRRIKLIDFMSANELKKEMEFQGRYVLLYYSSTEEDSPYRIIHIKPYYVLRNLLPFDIFYSMQLSKKENFSEYKKLPKNEKTNCNYVSFQEDLIMKIKFLDFETPSPSTLYNTKKEQTSLIIKFQDKDKQEVDILCTIIKKGKITVILHPNSILLNHASEELSFYYGKRKNKEKENKEIPGKISYRGLSEKKGNIFLLKNDIDKIHLKFQNYISETFSIDAIGTETIIKCKYSKINDLIYNIKDDKKKNNKNEDELKKKYVEFVMQNKIFLLAKDLDLYCNIIEFAPRYIIYNKLKTKLILSDKNNNEMLILQPGQREAFYFFGKGETNDIYMTIHEKNEEWEYSYPFTLENQNLITIQLLNTHKTKRKFINISSKLFNISTLLTFSEAKINNARVRIDNYSSSISMKIYQQGYQNSELFLDPCSKSIFAWPSQKSKKILRFNFGFGELSKSPIMISHQTQYEILPENLVIIKKDGQKKTKKYPHEEIINIYNNYYFGQTVRISISTDGEKFLIKIFDVDNNPQKKESRKIEEMEFQAEINKLGLSIISDNTYTTCHGKKFSSYNRIELCYITLENIQFYYDTEKTEEKNTSKIQFKFNYFEIDNQISPFTNFPIVIIPNYEYGMTKENSPDFFNIVYSSENNLKENIYKILELKFLIQSFYLNLESNLVSGILNLVKNITLNLKTSLTEIHPLFLSEEENAKNHIIISTNYSFPPWYTSVEEVDSDDNKNVFICYLETSPIDIIFSFISENKDKIFNELLMNNPVLRKFTTLFSNIEKTNLALNKDIRYNISGKTDLIFSSILDTYSQYALLQIMKVGVNIEILGSPVNLVKGFGTGVKDFFQKPVEGIINGPLEGIKGVYTGTKSLVKNTIGGTLNSVSKITSGFSKEILMLSQDEKYINERERKNMMNKPKNLVEGIGFGLSSMMSGIFYGVTDVVRKPLEGAKKDNLKGFGKGVLQGLGGLVSKPVSGVVDLISKTTDGFKNTWGFENDQIMQQRYPRPFYGKFKNIKFYNWIDAEVIYKINQIIPCFKKNIFSEYIGSLIYQNEKGEINLLVFGVNEFYLIEVSRFELILKLKYENIKTVYSDEKFNVRIEFKKKVNKKMKTSIKISKDQKEVLSKKIIKLFKESLNVEN